MTGNVQENKLVAVYGSLKKGFYNHPWLEGSDFVGYGSIGGFMYLCGSYPRLFTHKPKGDPLDHPLLAHTLELYSVPRGVYDSIESMEMGAGYYTEEINTKYGPAIVFLAEPDTYSTFYPFLTSYDKDGLAKYG